MLEDTLTVRYYARPNGTANPADLKRRIKELYESVGVKDV